MNILVLYSQIETFTSTVYEHLDSFARFSRNRAFFVDMRSDVAQDLHLFDAVIIHYSVRLPFDQISETTAQALAAFAGLKAVFIQDEYDHTWRTWQWIKRLGIRLVFSSVPAESMGRVYPPAEFPGVRFVSNLTGYAPEVLENVARQSLPSQRPLKIGYRGRALPVRYGALGQEKIEIGRMVEAFCVAEGIPHDISSHEGDRLYGPRWFEFIASCRAVLGTESGSNVFDWDGSLEDRIAAYRLQHPRATQGELYKKIVEPLEMPGVMNQVSPRIFEAIACRTVLVLFEGTYSGVIVPDRHFIPLRKDGGNLKEVMQRLQDGAAIDAMAELAFEEVLRGGKYGYESFMRLVDDHIASAADNGVRTWPQRLNVTAVDPLIMRSRPFRYQLGKPSASRSRLAVLGRLLPTRIKGFVKRIVKPLVTPPE